MLLKLMLNEEGKKEELTRGNLIDIVNYLKENKNIYNWVLDEDETIELPKLEEIETLRELKVELEKVDMSWWSLEIEEVEEGEGKMLKKLLKNEGLNFSHKWEFDGKEFEAEFEIQVEKGTEKEVQISVDQIKGRNSAICLFNEEYNIDEDEILIQDLESQNLEFVIEKFNLKEEIYERQLKEGSY